MARISRKIVYIAHPISGAVRSNISKIERIVESVMKRRGRYFPIAPYLDACRYLDDCNDDDRRVGIAMNKVYFEQRMIDELWVCGNVSRGVQAEINLAIEYGIDVVFKDGEKLVDS